MATGKQIRHYRLKLGWRLEDLEEASGAPLGTISALESRDSRRSEYFSAIAKAFGLTTEQLNDEKHDWPVVDTLKSKSEQVAIATGQHLISAHPLHESSQITGIADDRAIKWPFNLVTHGRLLDLKRALGRRAGQEAIVDIDKTLEIAVMKWEREASHVKSRVGTG